jgi:alpha-tubulin suppressor-like RCC1 family protein
MLATGLAFANGFLSHSSWICDSMTPKTFFSLFLEERLYACGSNEFGQIGGNSTVPEIVSLPSGLKISRVATGMGHTLLLTGRGLSSFFNCRTW